MPFRIRGNVCNHLSSKQCARCLDEWLSPPKAPYTVQFNEKFLEHAFDPWDPVRPVASREEMRVLCNEKGVTSHYLRDSLIWKSGETRWI